MSSIPAQNGVLTGTIPSEEIGNSKENGSYPSSVDEDGTELRRSLNERHVSMITLSAVVGVGLFLSSGKIIFLAGPGTAVIVFVIIISVVWACIACLLEMTALFPVKGPIFEFPLRFLDEGVGYAIGWVAWFTSISGVAAEILAVAQLFHFHFDESYLKAVKYPDQTLGWTFGDPHKTNPAIWAGTFLIVIFTINMFPVQIYGELEYICGCAKIVFIVGLIMFSVIINARKMDPLHATSSRFWAYSNPYSFESRNFTHQGHVLTGGVGHLAAVWTTMAMSVFAISGWETIAFTAAENRDLQTQETIKISTRKTALRIGFLYVLSVFVGGLNVPHTDPNLGDLALNSIGAGQNSIFVIGAVRNHLHFWPHFFTGFYIFSAASCGTVQLYNASRTLHALASIPEAWPQNSVFSTIRQKLERTKFGVPIAAAFVSWLVGLLAFLVVTSQQAETLSRISDSSSVSTLLLYCASCAAYLRFYKCIGIAASGDDPRYPTQAAFQAYKRDSPTYPYKTHGQYFRAWYGLIACSLLVFFNGWRSLTPPFDIHDFFASYSSVFAFITLCILYHMKLDGIDPRQWRIRTSRDLSAPMIVEEDDPSKRRGVLRRVDSKAFFHRENVKGFVQWLWIWLK